MKYSELKDLHPPADKVFFAFSEKQLMEGLEKIGATRDEVYSGIGGVIGRLDDIREFASFYEKNVERIAKECTPEEVFRDEWWNHECGYTGEDEEAIEIVKDIFGDDAMTRFDYKNVRKELWEKYCELN